jgi:hypothetical protein
MLNRVATSKLTDVSEAIIAPIIRAFIVIIADERFSKNL